MLGTNIKHCSLNDLSKSTFLGQIKYISSENLEHSPTPVKTRSTFANNRCKEHSRANPSFLQNVFPERQLKTTTSCWEEVQRTRLLLLQTVKHQISNNNDNNNNSCCLSEVTWEAPTGPWLPLGWLDQVAAISFAAFKRHGFDARWGKESRFWFPELHLSIRKNK